MVPRSDLDQLIQRAFLSTCAGIMRTIFLYITKDFGKLSLHVLVPTFLLMLMLPTSKMDYQA